MTFELQVFVIPMDRNGAEKKCRSLGHQFYRCGNCSTLIKVYSQDNHDTDCAGCEWKVYVLIEERGWR